LREGVAKGGKEVLSHRPVVAELLRVLAEIVPTGEAQSSNLNEHLLPFDGLEILLFVSV